MKTALLLVDVQRDFLDRPGLEPPPAELIPRLAALLDAFRSLGLPVLHVQTRIRPDGSDCMPHWERSGYRACIDGSAGAEPPAELAPAPDEAVFHKRFFSAFGNAGLEAALKNPGIGRIVLAGLYLHGCVRSTALDAYERGYEVWVAQDVVGSTEPVHAESTRAWLDGRAAEFVATPDLLQRLGCAAVSPPEAPLPLPAACVSNRWLEAGDVRRHLHRNPSNSSEILAAVPLCGSREITRAATAAQQAQRRWLAVNPAERVGLLRCWRKKLLERLPDLVECIVREVGKPVAEADEEVRRALAQLEADATLADSDRTLGPGVTVRYRPVGSIGLLTPWNNPAAIPIVKLAPALALGNAAVWKPSPQAAQTAMILMDTLISAGLPEGLVNLVQGDAETARLLMSDPRIAAVSLTGSTASGRAAAALCRRLEKPLQAELGGNNAAIVLADADLDRHAASLALSAFSYAGQRCTAIRRFIVEQSRLREFERRLTESVAALPLGDPRRPETRIGPMISPQHLARVQTVVTEALAGGARLVHGGFLPPGLQHGCWLAPALLAGVSPEAPVVREETFGPVAAILSAQDLDEAIALANAVPQGLVAGIVTENPAARHHFAAAIEAGIVKLASGPLVIHPEAPFGGWKASGIGPPEHGVWNLEFYGRPQAIYGDTELSC